ncbi:MAG: NADH-quinone oxidoreductase subunit M [Myxococcota bacterium]
MTLLLIVALPVFGALLGLLAKRWASYISLVSLLAVIALTLTAYGWGEAASSLEDLWLFEYKFQWLHFALDGLSFVLLLTAEALAAIGLVLSWNRPREQFYLLTTVAGLFGLLLSIDLLAFFIFWELMLLPVYFWVLQFGREKRNFAALQFIIFTQASGLLLLASIVALFVLTGTTNSIELMEIALPRSIELWIASGFILAFLIKLPVFPFHTWMPSMFDDAPKVAVISGLLLKTGAYGFLRFVLPMFPEISAMLAPFMMCLGVISVIYGAVLAFAQKNPRKVLAYATLSHAGLMLMGLFSGNVLALNGVIVLMVTGVLATAGLFISLELHLGFSIFFAMASIGLPGLGNFIGEWLLLFGLFQQRPWTAILGSLTLVLGAAYMLRLLIQLFYGENRPAADPAEFTNVKRVSCLLAAALLLWIGLSPAALLDLTVPAWTDANAVSPELPDIEPPLPEPGNELDEGATNV